MRVVLTAEEVGRLLARVAVEKANELGLPYRWGDHVGVRGDVTGIVAVLVDGDGCHVALYPLEEPRVPVDIPY